MKLNWSRYRWAQPIYTLPNTTNVNVEEKPFNSKRKVTIFFFLNLKKKRYIVVHSIHSFLCQLKYFNRFLIHCLLPPSDLLLHLSNFAVTIQYDTSISSSAVSKNHCKILMMVMLMMVIIPLPTMLLLSVLHCLATTMLLLAVSQCWRDKTWILE